MAPTRIDSLSFVAEEGSFVELNSNLRGSAFRFFRASKTTDEIGIIAKSRGEEKIEKEG